MARQFLLVPHHAADGFGVVADVAAADLHRALRQELGAQGARFDQADLYAQRPHLRRQALGQPGQRRLAGGVEAGAGHGRERGDRGNIDDVAAALRAQGRQHFLDQVPGAEEVGGEQLVGFRRGGLFHRAEQAVAGVVDHHVQARAQTQGLAHGGADLLGVGHVQGQHVQIG